MKSLIKTIGGFIFQQKERSVDSLIDLSNSIFKNDEFVVVFEDQVNPRFESFHGEGVVYLPQKYETKDSVYVKLKEKLGEELFPKFIAYHEFGHAAQVACTHNNHQIHIKGSSSWGDINYLFNGDTLPNKINNFMKELFKEGFADCYAGLCLFKETGDVKVFKRISQVRSTRYDEFKDEKGKHFIHPNFNVNAAANMGLTIERLTNGGKNIFDMPFTGAEITIERYIERAVIAGCVSALMNELETNDAFLSHFRKFTREFKLSEHDVKTVLHSTSVPIAQVMQSEKENGVSSFFFELHRRLPEAYKSAMPQDTLKKLLTDNVFKRDVASDLVLKDVVDIPYSAGLEGAKARMVSLRDAMLAPKSNTQAPKLN